MNQSAFNSWVNDQLEPDRTCINEGGLYRKRKKEVFPEDTVRNKEYAASFLPGESEYEREMRMQLEHEAQQEEYLKSKGII